MNSIKTTFTALIIFLTLHCSAQNKYFKDLDNVKIFSKEVTQLFKDNKINKAFSKMKVYWPLPENELENMETKTIQSMNLVAERFGKTEDIVKISEQNIKETAFRETYFIKFEYTAIRFIFTYYKNKNGWILNGFKWDDNFTDEFE